MRHRRATKILATLGPATSSPKAIADLWEAGADVFRFNFSHGSHADHAERFQLVRALEHEVGRPVTILADLQGPKIRVGTVGKGVVLENGAKFRLDSDPAPGDGKRAPLAHPEVYAALSEGLDLLLDDGRIRLRVTKAGKEFAETRVIDGGPLSSNKGVNLPGAVLPVPALTAKDRRDLDFALELGVDWVALSFVQRPDDVAELRKIVGRKAGVLAKLEKPAAVDRLGEIIDHADAVMVARGDLGVELPPEDVPAIQKRIVRLCRHAGKPVVVATQMLDSMIEEATPTRAEVSDVANAVYEGADAIMLSGETAMGAHPVASVAMMDRIIHRVETDLTYRPIMDAAHPDPQSTPADAITAAARQVAHTINAAAIVTYTTSGSTTLRASRERPSVPILCLTGSHETARRLVLAWGVECFFTHDAANVEEMVDHARQMAREKGFAESGAPIVITAGMPFGTPGATNILRIAWV
jgi:pyruvate kinase